MKIQMMIFGGPLQTFYAGCLESLVLLLAQEVAPLHVHLVADLSVDVGKPLLGLLLGCHAEVGTSQQLVQP